MRTFWAQPLQRQLLVANLLLAVPVLGLVAWESAGTLGEHYQRLGDRAQVLAAATATGIADDLETIDRLVGRLPALHEDGALGGTAADAALAQSIVGRIGVSDLVLLDREGRQVVRAVPHRAPATPPALDPAATTVQVAPARAVPGQEVAVGYPVRNDTGDVLGTLVVYLDLTRHDAFSMRPLLEELALPRDSVVTIADQERVLAWSSRNEDAAPASSPAPVAAAVTGSDADEWLRAPARIGNTAYTVFVAIPTTAVWADAWNDWRRTLGVLAVVLAGCFLMAWYVSRRVARSVSHLEATARRIATGDFGPIDRRPMFSPEFAELQAAFDAMLQRFNATRSALDAQMGEERRIRKELESLQGQVIQQERLAAVGQLVSGVAHEINNPLQAILGFSELLQMQSDVPENVKSDLRLIQKESTRACNIIRNLAMFARQQPGEAAPVMMTDVIGAVAELRQRRLQTEDIELHIDDKAQQSVKAVLTELQQVVLNFVVNAEQAIVQSGRLPGRIAIRSYDSAGRVVLEVEDTGPGVPRTHEAKLFQPFFTTKPVGQGTGLGLSISYGIIDSLGGRIGYRRSAVGGAIFYFELPAAARSDDESDDARVAATTSVQADL